MYLLLRVYSSNVMYTLRLAGYEGIEAIKQHVTNRTSRPVITNIDTTTYYII